MDLNEETLNKLIKNELVIDCIKIVLRQQTEHDPITFSGSGSISQRDDGIFYLKSYHSHMDVAAEQQAIRMVLKNDMMPGKIIDDDYYFSLKAIDLKGNEWSSEYVDIRSHLHTTPYGMVINTDISSLYTSKERVIDSGNEGSDFLFCVVPGEYTIPCNKSEEQNNGGWSRNTSEINVLGANVRIKNKKDWLEISLRGPKGCIDRDFRERLLEALNIIFGKLCTTVYFQYASGEQKYSCLKSIPSSIPNRTINSPIRHVHPKTVKSFEEFINKYMTFFKVKNASFYGYWHKINRAWQAGIEHTALTVSTSIEGVVKNYYSELGMPDCDFLLKVESVRREVKKLKIDRKIQERIISNLGYMKSSTVKNTIHELSCQGWFLKNVVNDWVELRNKSAHGNDISDDPKELQKYIDLVYSSIGLFYVLLLKRIQFSGIFIDYWSADWKDDVMIYYSYKSSAYYNYLGVLKSQFNLYKHRCAT